MARVAIESVDLVLANICNTIVAHEKRHEIAYERIVEKLREVDPTYTVAKMIVSNNIKIHRQLMNDCGNPYIFSHFSALTQCIGVYMISDYIDRLEFLIGR